MDRVSKVLVAGVISLSLLSIGWAGYKYFVQQDYVVQASVDCDPSLEVCFVAECDPEEEECSLDPAENTTYYKIIEKSARSVSLCTDEDCGPMACGASDTTCVEILCDPVTAEETGDACSTADSLTEEEGTIDDLEQPDGATGAAATGAEANE